MKVAAGVDVGAATRAGPARVVNEDDLLLLEPAASERVGGWDRLLVVADGMGGVSGGAEASRAAVRALAGAFLREPPPAGLAEGMRRGFAAACSAVAELARQSRSLRGMGTTLTALVQSGDRAVVGHVGDSRCWLWRGKRLRRLTEDHATGDGARRLLRCIGGGRSQEDADVVELEVRAGDAFLLATDGLWSVVPDAEIAAVLGRGEPARATAEALVARASRRGGGDDATAVVLVVERDPAAARRGAREVELPPEEMAGTRLPRAARRSLRRPVWPWVLLLGSLLALAALLVEQIVGAR